ncbi:MAG: sigma factor-like helix-turn-helix DNA-binding protein [Halofilum sp. (in: g-proteobacteria)]|nr:sigma factor-like helix-turn-helix DNA-binding protein [Halofilum sp. (in: g-proteobacteria)]
MIGAGHGFLNARGSCRARFVRGQGRSSGASPLDCWSGLARESARCLRSISREDVIVAAHATGGCSYQQIAEYFGVHITTVGRFVRAARDALDLPPGALGARGP